MSPDSLTVVVGIFSAPVWTLDSSHVDTLRQAFPDVRFLEARTHDELADRIADADVAFSSMVRAQAFARASRLRWIHSSAAGVGATLFPALVESDVVLTNSRGVQAPAIGEHILAAVLAWRRRLHLAVRRHEAGAWAQDELSASLDPPPLAKTRALIVGMGSIGSEAARLLRAIGMQVEGLGKHEREGVHGAGRLPELVPHADVVVITAPHTQETDGLFDAAM
mgnify:CR=1 FL=1